MTSAAQGASTFEPGLRLLPRDLQADARKLYGLLRTVDDLVDEHDPQAASRVNAIERWAHAEEADTPETRTLSALAQRYPVPPESIIEFCQGMRHDLAEGTLASETDLERYCQYVGGAIGVVLTRMFGSTDPSCEDRMAMLGRAFQRTNILRDIDEDHDHGRVYVARRTIERFGSPTPGAREALMRDQIARADQLYDEGLSAIPLLSRGGRGMAVSVSLYREILRQIEREGYGRQRGRINVPSWRMHLLVLKHRLKPTYV
ncbi:MAG TPA: phytoene/squalene synthase family protein [Solirubrobacteraceae bacterium]